MTDEEVAAWLTEMRRFDARVVHDALDAEKGRQFRPRPGELVELVQARARQLALRGGPVAALNPGRRELSEEERLRALAEIRALAMKLKGRRDA